MTKVEFTLSLCEKLSFLPWEEVEERVAFYNEMIDDRMEEGFSEEDAVAQIGTVEKIAEQIIADTPFTKLVKRKIIPKKKLGTLEIVLIILGSPIWLSLMISVFAVVLSLYISLWAVVICLWAAFVAVLACGFGGVAAGVVLLCVKSGLIGLLLIGCGFACIGVSILLFFACNLATRSVVLLLKQLIRNFKNRIAKRSDFNE